MSLSKISRIKIPLGLMIKIIFFPCVILVVGMFQVDFVFAQNLFSPNQDQSDPDGISDTPHAFTGGQDRKSGGV